MNVADLFFDLLFVAAAYNTGNIIKNSPTWRGLLYFLGTFLPMTDIWQNKLYYEARYIVKDDLYHRLTDTAIVLVVAAAVLHIRPVAVLSDPRGNTEMFVFCLAQLVACLLQFIAEIELYMCAKGDRTAIQKGALRTVQMRILPFLCFLSAAIVAGYYYYDTDDSTNSGSGSYRRVLAGDDGTASTYNNSNNSTTTTTNDYYLKSEIRFFDGVKMLGLTTDRRRRALMCVTDSGGRNNRHVSPRMSGNDSIKTFHVFFYLDIYST